MQREDTKRIFIAFNLPDDAKTEAGILLETLKRELEGVRWVRPEIMHSTLHFLGDLDNEQIGRVKLAMQSLAGKFKAFRFRFGKTSGFPNNRHPKVIFLECRQTNGNSVFKFQKLLGEKLEQNGISVDARSWRPHITLGRVKDPGAGQFGDYSSVPRVDMTVDMTFDILTYDLMESTLGRDGPEYTILERFNLIPT
jgi:2'-5' RNA ligase